MKYRYKITGSTLTKRTTTSRLLNSKAVKLVCCYSARTRSSRKSYHFAPWRRDRTEEWADTLSPSGNGQYTVKPRNWGHEEISKVQRSYTEFRICQCHYTTPKQSAPPVNTKRTTHSSTSTSHMTPINPQTSLMPKNNEKTRWEGYLVAEVGALGKEERLNLRRHKDSLPRTLG